MHSIFDNVYLGKPCAEQHMREIRQEIQAEQLARQAEGSQAQLVIGSAGRARLDPRLAIGRFWSRLVTQTHILEKSVKVMETDGNP